MALLISTSSVVANADDEIDSELKSLTRTLGLDGRPELPSTMPDILAPLPRLGKALFFSKQLSGDRDVACATCHHPQLGGTDRLSLSVGIGASDPDVISIGRVVDLSRDPDPAARTIGGPNVRRNALTTINAALYQRNLLHDGRIALLGIDDTGKPLYRTPDSRLRDLPDTLVEGDLVAVQAHFPVVSFDEMRGFDEFYAKTPGAIRLAIAERLRQHPGWLQRFREGFESPEGDAQALITFNNIGLALSAYQHSQILIQHPWQNYLDGDNAALTTAQKRGALLFFKSQESGGFGCVTCHSGDFFTDEKMHVAGFPQLGRGKRVGGEDPGRYLVTQHQEDRYRFRTPTLLNVTETGPWGHAGSFASLADTVRYHADPVAAIDDYDFSFNLLAQFAEEQGLYPNAPELTRRALETASPLLPGRLPTAPELADLTAFLAALTDPCVANKTCMAQWMPSTDDNVDGHLMAINFRESPGITLPATRPLTAAIKKYPPPPVYPDRVKQLRDCQVTTARSKDGAHQFVDRTRALGVDHRHFMPGVMWFDERYAASLEVAMQFAPLAVSDIDNDCWPDFVYATHEAGKPQVLVYRNLAGKRFDKLPPLLLPQFPDAIGSIGLADLDGDYEAELIVGNAFGARETVVLDNQGQHDWQVDYAISMSKSVFGIAFGDYSGDGWIDAFLAHWDTFARPGFAPAALRNDGGRLVPGDVAAGTTGADLEQNFHFSPGFVDLDSDGDQDLLITSDFGTSEVLENIGGRYRVITDRAIINDENGMGAAIGDFNNDGYFDWFVSAIHSELQDFKWGNSGNRLYQGKGLAFEDVTDAAGLRDSGWAWGACAADFNNDGWLDLFVENGYGFLPEEARQTIPDIYQHLVSQHLSPFNFLTPHLYINQGDGTFRDAAEAWGIGKATNGRGVACVDYDRDGDIDLATTDNSAPPRILQNQLAADSQSHFIGLHLIGKPPNTSALGAVVKLTIDGTTQVRQVELNSNFQSLDPGTLHFGVGATKTIDQITIRWPGGTEQNLRDVPANRYYSLTEPD